MVFPRVCTNGLSLKYCGSVVVCSFWVSQDHRPAHVDLFTQLSSNNFSSTVKRVHHKTCSVTTHAQCHLMLRLRIAAKRKCSGTNKNAFFASCSSSSSAHVAVELHSFFALGRHRESGFEKVDLIVHGKMSFLFTITEYVKIRFQLQIYDNVILLMIFIVDHPV